MKFIIGYLIVTFIFLLFNYALNKDREDNEWD